MTKMAEPIPNFHKEFIEVAGSSQKIRKPVNCKNMPIVSCRRSLMG